MRQEPRFLLEDLLDGPGEEYGRELTSSEAEASTRLTSQWQANLVTGDGKEQAHWWVNHSGTGTGRKLADFLTN